MPQTTANGVTIHYEDHGNPSDPAMLLIMGFGAQLTLWPDELVEALVGHGFRVIRYDNRDVGLSQKFTGQKASGPVKLTLLTKIGLTPRVPYTLADMAEDAVGLMDALEIERAHIVGASMGGMIAQHVAAKHADRCLSFTQIFSTTGNPKLPAARKEALQALVKRPRILLLDEPFGALDPGIRSDMHRLITDLWNAYSLTVIMVTHDIGEAFSLGNRVLTLDKLRHDPHAPNRYGASVVYDLPLTRKDPPRGPAELPAARSTREGKNNSITIDKIDNT